MPRLYGLGIPASHANFGGELAMLPYTVNGTGHPNSITPADNTNTGALPLWAGAPEPVPQAGAVSAAVTWPPPTARNHSASPAAAATAATSRIVMSGSRGALSHTTARRSRHPPSGRAWPGDQRRPAVPAASPLR